MKIYIVLNDGDYNNWNVIGLYDNLEKAQIRREEYAINSSYDLDDSIILDCEIGDTFDNMWDKVIPE